MLDTYTTWMSEELVGFIEEHSEFWGEGTPYLVMVKSIYQGTPEPIRKLFQFRWLVIRKSGYDEF